MIVSSGFGSRPGLLRYLGETQFAPGNWCGVELDEASGKNDGAVDGIRWEAVEDEACANLNVDLYTFSTFLADILNANPSTASLCPLPRCRCRHPQRRRVSHAAVRANLSPRLAQWTALRQRTRRACAWMLRYKASACQGAPPDTRHPSTPSLTEFFKFEFWILSYLLQFVLQFTIYTLTYLI